MIVILILLLVFVVEDHLLFCVVDRWLEHPIGPLILLAPLVFLVLVFEVVVADIRIAIGYADIDALILQHS